MGNIEKRVSKEGLAQFLFSHPTYFSGLKDHEVADGGFRRTLEGTCPGDWQVNRQDVWYVVQPPEREVKAHGFKIHVSLVSDIVDEALASILPVLVRHEVTFKILVDKRILDFFNSQACNRASAGKFITIYPENLETFKHILADLHEQTTAYFGPYILSDRPYKQSKCLFYRYGAFRGSPQKDVTGDSAPIVINDQTGETDSRQPYFLLPQGIEDPFDDAPDYPASALLRDRYKVQEGLANHSSKGGVYLAVDIVTGKKVVLKEARPFINRSIKSRKDAISGSQHEEETLRALDATGVAPKVIDAFQEWRHRFLVLEYIDWPTLAYFDRKHVNDVIAGNNSLIEFCQWHLQIVKKLVEGVVKIHNCGIVIGDLAPQNILVEPDTLEVKFIDFEGAYNQETEGFYAPITSLGFSAHKDRIPSEADDWQAVCAVSFHLLHPVCAFFSLQPGAQSQILQALVSEAGLPAGYLDLGEALAKGGTEAISFIDELMAGLDDTAPQGIALANPVSAYRETIAGIVEHIGCFRACPLTHSIIPLDYRGHAVNPLSASYGLAGVCYFLHSVQSEESEWFLDQLQERLDPRTVASLPPGLYIGLSGVAWILSECDRLEESERLMSAVYRQPSLFDAEDLFYGAAGWGLASLYFHQKTGRDVYLRKALEAAELLRTKLQMLGPDGTYKNIDGHHYSGLLHGSAGLALFFLRLFEASADQEHLVLAERVLASETSRAMEAFGGPTWQRDYDKPTTYPYYRFGSAGIGMVVLRFYHATANTEYLTLAKSIGRGLAGKYSLCPGYFSGMAGIGSFFLDLYRATGDITYLDEANGIASKVLLYRSEDCSAITFPGEELVRYTTDLGTGSSGIGMFLRRLLSQGQENELFLDMSPAERGGADAQ